MRLRLNGKVASLVVMASYPILYYIWVKQMNDSWVTTFSSRFITISSITTAIYCTQRQADTLHDHNFISSRNLQRQERFPIRQNPSDSCKDLNSSSSRQRTITIILIALQQ